jgi:heat shock protein HslJ
MKTTVRLFVLLLLAGLSLAACSEPNLTREAHPPTLNGTIWRVVTVNGRPPVVRSEPTAAFGDAMVTGSSGCNSYGGAYTYDPSTGAIKFQDLAMTLMLCMEPGRNEVETLFNQAINAATSASMDAQGRLVLSGPGGQIVFAVDAVPS